MHHGDATLEISKYVGILQKLFKVPWCNTYVLRRHTRFLEPFIKVGNFFQSSPATVSLSPLLYLLDSYSFYSNLFTADFVVPSKSQGKQKTTIMESLPTEILDHILKQIKCEFCQKYQIKLNYLYQKCSKTCSRWNNILEKNMLKQLPFPGPCGMACPCPDNMIQFVNNERFRFGSTLLTIKQLTRLEKEFHFNNVI